MRSCLFISSLIVFKRRDDDCKYTLFFTIFIAFSMRIKCVYSPAPFILDVVMNCQSRIVCLTHPFVLTSTSFSHLSQRSFLLPFSHHINCLLDRKTGKETAKTKVSQATASETKKRAVHFERVVREEETAQQLGSRIIRNWSTVVSLTDSQVDEGNKWHSDVIL